MVVVIVLSVLLVAALVVCGLLAYRISQLRSAGTPVVLRELPAAADEGWRHGTIHYSDDSLRYFRLTALRPGPTLTFPRQTIEISGRRLPAGTEGEILEDSAIVGLVCGADDQYELAMSPGAVTAFQSWLESRQSVRSQRRRGA